MINAEQYALENMQGTDLEDIKSALIGFAKIWGEEILTQASEKAKTKLKIDGFIKGTPTMWDVIIDKDSILKSVNLDEIK